MSIRTAATWLRSTMGGHIVYFEVTCGLPCFLVLRHMFSSQEVLTLARIVKIGTGSAIVWGIGGIFFWYVVTKPLLRRRGERVK